MSSSENEGPIMLSGTNRRLLGIKSDSATSSDCATRIAQVCSRIAQLALRNLACATPRIAQLRLRNFQHCATLIAQLLALRNSACATFDRLRNSQDCATLWSDCAARIAQLGLCNLACATPRIAQLRVRKFQDCATLIAQLCLPNCF
jgi:hypothetical protein